MKTPRYMVYKSPHDVRTFDMLAKALIYRDLHGGIVYEPLGMSTAEKVIKEETIYIKYGDETDS